MKSQMVLIKMFWVKLAWHSELHFHDVTQLQLIMCSRNFNQLWVHANCNE